MKRILSILCISLTIIWVAGTFQHYGSHNVPVVEISQPIRKTLNSKVHCIGTLESKNTSYIAPEKRETVTNLLKKSGDRVSKGELLFKTLSESGEKSYYSPISGVIGRYSLKEYTETLPGISFLQIISTDDLVVSCELDEIYLSDIRKGLPVELSLEAYPSRAYAGTISEITPYASASGGLAGLVLDQGNPAITLSIDISGDTSDLIPGLSVSGDIITRTENDAILVPSSAVFAEGEEEYLFCYQDGRAYKKIISTGLYYDGYYQITKGITFQDSIILNPDDSLSDGMKVLANA